jgi:hypothetical protein
MPLASGALETYACALGTCGSSCTGRLARLFFILEIHDPQGTVGRVAAGVLLAGRQDPEL